MVPDEEASYVTRVVAFLRAAQPARAVANALLDLGLPRIRAWLREKAGPTADVGEIRIEKDRALVHLDRLRVPLGARGLLVLDHASATIVRGKSGLPEARLQAYNGVLSFGAGDESFRAEVSFVATPGADEDAWIAGDLTIAHASWTARGRGARGPRGRGAPEGVTARAMTGKARLYVSPSEWRLEEGLLETTTDARVRFAGHGALDGRTPLAAARLDLETARVGPFADALTAIGGQALTVPTFVPLDALLRGEITWDAKEGGRCVLTIQSEAIDATIHAHVAADGGGLEGRVEADVRPAVTLRAANIAPKVLPRPEDRVRIEVDVKGRVDHPIAHGTIRASEVGFRFGRPRFVPCPIVRAMEGTVDVEGNIARARLAASVGQGKLVVEAEGDLREPSDLRANVTLDHLDGGFVREVLFALGLPIVVPKDLHVSGKLRGEGSAISGAMLVKTARSHVAIEPLHLAGRDPTGTRIVASVAVADVLEAGLDQQVVRLEGDGSITLELDGKMAEDGSPMFSGPVKAPALGVTVAPRAHVAPPFALEAIEGRVDVGLDAVRLSELRFRAYEGRWRAEATLPFVAAGATYSAWVEDASAALVVELASLAGGRLKTRVARDGTRPPDEMWIAPDARVVGEIHGGASRATIADVALETKAGTALVFHGEIGKTVQGSTLRGNVALADVLLAGAFTSALRPLPEGSVRIDAKLKGPPDAIVMMGYVAAPILRLAIEDNKAPPFVVTDVSSLFRVDANKTMWHRCLARLYGGALTSAGVVGHDPAFTGMQATIALANVAVEHLPIDEGTVAPFVRGALSATVRFDQKSDTAPLVGKGTAQLDEGAFPALLRGTPALAKYGLAPPPEHAIAPATVNVDLDERGWSFRAIHAWVKGASATGDVRVGMDGALLGYVTVLLEEDFLRSSAILVLPGVLAERLTLPVRLKGTLARPIVDADLGTCFNKFVTENKVSSFFISAVEEAAVLLGAQPAPPMPVPPSPASPVTTKDDAVFEALLAESAEWDEIESRLDEHRRSQIRYRVG